MEMGSSIIVCLMLLCATCTLGKRLGCPPSCKCSEEVLTCPPGSAPALDSCGCGCTVCVQGLGSGCDGFAPCDASQNLVCDYQGDSSRQRGVCMVRHEPKSCFHNGVEILHGQEFEIDCNSYCKCDDGNIDCVPLCPEPEKPLVPNCTQMQLVTVPGECCAQWRCLEETSGSEDWDEPGDTYPGPDDVSTEAETKTRSRREAPDPDTEQDEEESLEETYSCKPDTEWTPCSRTCGFGNSVRIVYENETCLPKAEKRLCMIRPCKGQYPSANYTVLKASNLCSRVLSWSRPIHLRFRDCLSSRPLLPKFCGHCSDGRFCTPSLSHTRRVSFQCAQLQRKVTRQVMWVQRCECGGKRGMRGKKKKEGHRKIRPREEMTNEVVGGDI